ncbi:NAD(P)H-dependent flavin oxidoreductase [Ornithinibacillus halotolerans]|uniref:Probable nitronate monooxygenase n=1 Tax=Ornithinibacillus halotolerans TaxID=1274357 RepID=A0A916WBG5_9BACI|nr:nitronate monooxygenase [Ornithinibacillus halotolerans]GGA82927.1 2-nitropropane dioxygenase [Ornithinibacillus halotolerans]
MNRVTNILNIQYPIIQGGMGNISNAELTAAVSEAGGLGTIGCGTMPPTEVEKIILETKERTLKPFALNIAITVSPYVAELIDLSIKHDIPVISLSAGNPAPYIPKLHEHGKIVMAIVASVKHAQKAEAAGADILVAEGYEAAGINSSLELTTFTLIPQIAQKVKKPIVAAGGIGDGKGLAAAVMLGAEGVQMGTRFIATKEAPFHPIYKEKLIQANGTDAIIIGRSIGRIRRVLNTNYVLTLMEKEKQGVSLQEFTQHTSEYYHVNGAKNGNLEQGFLNSGQVAGLIEDIPSVEELIDDMIITARNQIHSGLSVLDQLHQYSSKDL